MFSKALAERGLNFGDGTTANPPPRLMVEAPDWLVARASEEAPRSCLIWGDAADDTKVVRPRKAKGQWVSLSALNALRRTEPLKASRLWYETDAELAARLAPLRLPLLPPRQARLLACKAKLDRVGEHVRLALVALVLSSVRLSTTRRAVLASRGACHVLELASSARDACVGVV